MTLQSVFLGYLSHNLILITDIEGIVGADTIAERGTLLFLYFSLGQ